MTYLRQSRGRYKAHDCKRNPAISIDLSLFYTVSKFIIILDKKTNKKLVLKYFENNDDKFNFMLFWTPELYNVMKCVVYVIMTRKQHLIFDYENFWTNTYAYMQE